MITSNYFANKTFLIIGMGLTGKSLVAALLKSKAKIFHWDDNRQAEKKLKRVKSKKFSNKKDDWNKIDYVLPSPGIVVNGKSQHNLINLAKEYKKKIISELDLFQIAISEYKKTSNAGIKIIAVTGTNGKSTIVSLIHHLLKSKQINSSLIGNIGNSIFHSKVIKDGVYIIEASSYQLELSKIFSPNIAVISNLSNDHLNRHKNIKNYMKQKSKIFQNLDTTDTAILNCNHSLIKTKVSELIKLKKSNVVLFDFKSNLVKTHIINKNLYTENKIKKIIHNNNALKGFHNEENIQIVFKVLEHLGVKNNSFKKELNNYIGLPHRQELIFKSKKLVIINDSKATNIESMITAIKNYKNIYLICGGILKDRNLSIIKPYIKKINKVYVTGLETDFLVNFFNKKNKVFTSSKLSEIIEHCFNDVYLSKNATILFSPGAASFDQYNNFEHRGETFRKLILRKMQK